MNATLVIVGDGLTAAAALKILALCAAVWVAAWVGGRLYDRNHRPARKDPKP